MKPYLYMENKTIGKMHESWKDEHFIEENGNVYMNFQEVMIEDHKYLMVVDGEIYNTEELKENFFIENVNDDEFICFLFYWYGKNFVEMLDGSFTLVICDQEHVYFARDKLGTRIAYYSENGALISNSINCLIQLGNVFPVMKKKQILEMFTVGPGNVDGNTFLDNISSLTMGTYMYQKKLHVYYYLKSEKHRDSLEETIEKIKILLKDAVNKQMKKNRKAFLSGGIDSSILCALLSNHEQIDTYSLEYEENDQYFTSNSFQNSQDRQYVELMSHHLHSHHHNIVITQQELLDALDASMYAREVFGMGDIDASLYLLCEKLKEEDKVIIASGEISDEIFGGYPWFYKEEYRNCKGFPWVRYMDERIGLLNHHIRDFNYQEYGEKLVSDVIETIEFSDDNENDRFSKIQTMLCLKYFGQVLMRRQTSQSEVHGVEIKAPFCDLKLVEYVYNIPWDMKFYLGKEKGLLRKTFEDILPDEIVNRKKNPFPKTHHPVYAQMIKEKMLEVFERKDSILHQLFDDDKLLELIESEGKSFVYPWFGQLMNGPQLLAYLYQIDLWAKTQHVIIDI